MSGVGLVRKGQNPVQMPHFEALSASGREWHEGPKLLNPPFWAPSAQAFRARPRGRGPRVLQRDAPGLAWESGQSPLGGLRS